MGTNLRDGEGKNEICDQINYLKNTYISDSLVNLAIAAATDPKPLFLMLVQLFIYKYKFKSCLLH